MKKYILLSVLLLGSICCLQAQGDNSGNRAEKIQALKIAFITQNLDLTTDEAQKFWPVYGQYEKEIKIVLADNKNEDVLENDEKLLNVRKKYRPEFTKILGQPRMNKLFGAEKEFRKMLLQRLKNKNNQ